jgi:hypothetical protein
VERYALWAFLVDAADEEKRPSVPLVVEGAHIREATLTISEFKTGVSRLGNLQQEFDKVKTVKALLPDF